MDIEETLRLNIKANRKALGLSQERLAELVDVASSETISKYELGKRKPTLKNLERFRKVFDITYDELLGVKLDKKQNASLKKLLAEVADYTDEDFKILIEFVKLLNRTRKK